MEVHQARAFLAVADELHFGRAAIRLHIAQPPLSRLIRRLEQDLDAPLFDRSTRHVSLTAQGEALLEPARELVMLSERIKDTVKRSQGGEIGRVRVGFAGASVNPQVGDLAEVVRHDAPGIALEMHSSQFSHVGLDRVLGGSLDLAIGRWDFLPAQIDSRLAMHEELQVALPEAHPLAAREAIGAEDLADESWVVLPGGAGATLPNRLNAVGVAAGFVPRIVQVAPDSWTLVALVGAEMGVALTLSSVRDNVPARGVVFRPLVPAPPPVQVRLVWRRDDANPALRRVLQLARTVFPDDDHVDTEAPS